MIKFDNIYTKNYLGEIMKTITLYTLVALSVLFIGCGDENKSETTLSVENPDETSISQARNMQPSCTIDKGFGNEIECYEGDASSMKRRCDDIQKIMPDFKVKYSANTGCPTDKKYIGCCVTDTLSARCFYLSDIYDTGTKANEWIASTKSDCVVDINAKWEK